MQYWDGANHHWGPCGDHGWDTLTQTQFSVSCETGNLSWNKHHNHAGSSTLFALTNRKSKPENDDHLNWMRGRYSAPSTPRPMGIRTAVHNFFDMLTIPPESKITSTRIFHRNKTFIIKEFDCFLKQTKFGSESVFINQHLWSFTFWHFCTNN